MWVIWQANTNGKQNSHFGFHCKLFPFVAFVVLIGVFDNSKLYCKSRDLMYSTGEGNETVFCIISGNIIISLGKNSSVVHADGNNAMRLCADQDFIAKTQY